MYSIDDFWIPTLGKKNDPIPIADTPAGWVTGIESFGPFVEAPLKFADDFGEEKTCPILLISAPGAVGKSTLANEIAARTGSILVDLSKAEAVGGSTITGGLARAGLYGPFADGDVALLIDGLDEARIRVTKDSFSAFLDDIIRLADGRRKPVTLFGRTSAIEDAWLALAEMGIEPPVLEIQFYGSEAALEFVTRRIASDRAAKGDDVNAAADADMRAASRILLSLGTQAHTDGEKFVGYAPVLIAVAKRVAAERNPMALVQALERGQEALSLNGIVDAIMERETAKLERLEFGAQDLKAALYGRAEQIERLISAVYEIDHQPDMPEMSQEDAEKYNNALKTWVPEHPFTDGSGITPSSEVFGGFIAAEALKKEWAADYVRKTELESPKVNPFVWRFRLPEFKVESEDLELGEEPEFIPLADLSLAFTSLQALLPHSEFAHLHMDADVEINFDQGNRAEVEITRYFDGGTKVLRLSSNCAGELYFGPRISDVDISGNELSVVASGSEITLTAPVELDVGRIDAGYSGIVIECPRLRMDSSTALVRLRCSEFKWSNNALKVRPGVKLVVDWPGSEQHPWRRHRRPDTPDGVDEEIGERFRRLRKILVLFRSRGMGQLAKFKGAIDHERRTRGSGAAVRDLLLDEGVLYRDGRVYVLNTDRMSEVLGLTFLEIQSATVNEQTIEFLRRV